jgi:transglycosylase-like protein with SLT domain/D-alanyl-D-alanine carboxypeptidase-like protein
VPPTTPLAEQGQALPLVCGALAAVLIGAVVLGGVARAVEVRGDRQRAADLAVLAGARAMSDAYSRVFAPADLGGRPNPAHLERAEYLARARRSALTTARRNGASDIDVVFPGDALAPLRIRVAVRDRIVLGPGASVSASASAEAEVVPPSAPAGLGAAGAGEYAGPLEYRQGKPMRPDVARAFDRMAASAAADGVSLIVNSAFRTNAEQAALFARHPDPKWVAPPGQSLHRLGTELDLGPAAAYGWLSRNAGRFHFVQRYSWEPWHYGFTLNAGTASVGFGGSGGDGDGTRTLQSFVPARFAPAIANAARRWSVAGTLLAAQLYKESRFNPFARSPAGAQGIAQFMPGTARAIGLADPFDAVRAIDAQAHLMRDLLRQFGAVPLALAAYNAGPAPVMRCGCVPAIPETQAYVADILGLLNGAGDALSAGLGGPDIRLVA